MSEFIEVNLDSWNDLCKERDALREQNKALEQGRDAANNKAREWESFHIGLQVKLRSVEAERDRMKKALENAVDLITFEYCSHSEPHSATLTACYAKEQLAALHYDMKQNKGETK